MRTRLLGLALLLAAVSPWACADDSPTATVAAAGSLPGDLDPGTSAASLSSAPLPPIFIEPLTGRHQFTDDVATQIRLKPAGRAREVLNLTDVSKIAVLRLTLQPGARFPWHTHPGPVLVAVTQGELVYVYADDCVERDYGEGTAFVDPGFDNVHFAFNPTAEETVLVATFLGVPDAGALTIPVAADEGTALDARCGVAPAASAGH